MTTQPAKSNEPSMEEILASIRRIIADDDATKAPQSVEASKPAPPVAPPTAPPPRVPAAPTRSNSPTAIAPEVVLAAVAPKDIAGDDAQSADILDLSESMAAVSPPAAKAPQPMPAPQFRTIDGNSDLDFDEDADKPMAPAASSLISRATSAAVDSAFNSLAQTVLVQNARTLEDLVREMLRPMLKSWLDENLPNVVERLVRGEIERVSRGR
jgi:uncharacterized protein